MRTENDYTETDLGNISPNSRGEYDEKASYEYLDLISYQGGSYLCLAEPKTIVSGIAPKAGQNTEVWQMIALPGELTPEYIAMHDDTIAKAKQTEASRTAAELAQEAAETARTDVVQMHSETLQAATEARENCDSSAGYAQAAELSRKAAAESEQNINAQVTGFETEMSKSVTQATEQIATARQKAVQTITSQQDTSVQAVKDQTAAYISEKNTEAKKEITDHAEQEIVRINAQDSVQQIQKNKEDVALLKEDKADKTSLAQTDRKLDALWKLNQGISYEFRTDEAEAYQKTVPSGAKMASVEKIGGRTLVWNQLNLNSGESITKNGISFINNKDGSWTINGTCSVSNDDSIRTIVHLFATKYVSGHKYLVKTDKYSDGNYGFAINGSTVSLKKAVIINYAFNPVIFVKDKVTVDNVTMRMNIFDLTQMFGAGNEPTIEEFEAMFPADYYPYNAGELMSASVNEVIYLDTKNQETSYPIPQAILNLPGYGWSAGNVRNEVNWENKKYHKRVGKVDLGTVNMNLIESGFFFAELKTAKPNTQNVICSRYKNNSSQSTSELTQGLFMIANGSYLYIKDANYTDSETFNQSLSGVMLYYELAEEQITDISDLIGDTLQEPIEVEAGGSLTFKNTHGANYRVPVPNTVEYTVKLSEVAK